MQEGLSVENQKSGSDPPKKDQGLTPISGTLRASQFDFARPLAVLVEDSSFGSAKR